MIKSAFHRSKRRLFALMGAGALCAASCTVIEMDDVPRPDDSEQSDYVQVSASVRASLASRAYPESGQVIEGNFVLTYPFSLSIVNNDTTYTYNTARVRFGTEGLEDMGFVTYFDPKKNADATLKWSEVVLRKTPPKVNNVTPPQTAFFYLDNVPAALHNAGSSEQDKLNKNQNLVIFYDDESIPESGQRNPFRAGLFDYANRTNDLLWGWTLAEKNAKIVRFQETERGDFRLHHNMSRLRVVIDAKQRDDTSQEAVNFSKEVKLELIGLHHVPLFFDRSTGNLTLQPKPESENELTLVKFAGSEMPGTDPVDANNPESATIPWATIETVDTENSDETFNRYTSYDFVVPPQELANDENRPKLRLTVPAKYVPGRNQNDPGEVVYEANLPQNMYYAKQEGSDTNDLPAMPFSFLKEYDMTIRAVVGPPDLELRFAPVYVQDWIGLDAQEISGNQAGIYTNQDFYDFMDCYLNKRAVRLERYGYRASEDEPWKILFWSSALKLKLDKENTDPNDGIWEYLAGCVEEDFFKNNPFQFVFNNNVVNLTDDTQYPQLDGASGQLRLYSYITGKEVEYPGIKDADHFLEMIDAYNSKSFKSLLPSFGAYDNTYEQWEIEFTETAGGGADATIELVYEDIAKTMFFFEDGTYGGAGNFKFNFRGHPIKVVGIPDLKNPGRTISITLEGVEGEQILHAIVANPEGLYSAEDVALLIRAYNSLDTSEPDADGDAGGAGQPDSDDTVEEAVDLSWLLPHFGVSAGDKWTFRFIKPMELWGPDIYGAMVPNLENSLPDYTFEAVNSKLVKDNTITVKVSDTGSAQYSYSYNNNSFGTDFKKLFAEGGIITTVGNISSMITYANNGNPVYRRYYGWYDESNAQWIYPINPAAADGIRKIEVEYATIFAKLTSNEPTVFQLLNDSRVVVTKMPNGAPDLLCRGEQGAEILYKILKGYYTPEDYKPGIELSSDFDDLIKAYNADDLVALQRYGTFDEALNKWVFKFTETAENPMTVSFSKLEGKMKPKQNIEYAFDFGGHALKLTDLPVGSDPNSLDIAGTSGAALLHAILTDQQKLTSPDDVAWMIQAYNGTVTVPAALSLTRGASAAPAPAYDAIPGFRPVMRPASVPQPARHVAAPLANEAAIPRTFDWILRLYGTQSGGRWNFHYADTMELDGPSIYGKMTPDSGNGKPDYSFTFDFETVPDVGEGQETQPAEKYVTVADGSYRANVVSYYLKRLFTGVGEIVSADELIRLARMTQENPILWRYFGKPAGSGAEMTWTFPITASGSISVAYNDLFGKFAGVADDKFTLTLADGLTVKVTPLPDVNYRKIECSGPDGAETLESILRGTYVNPAPEIKTAADFRALIAAYNNNQTEELPAYGKFEGGKWTFHVSGALTELTLGDIYGQMKSGSGKPDYEFTYDASGSVTIETKTVDAAHLKILLAASGAVNSKDDLLALLTDNAVTRRYYGTPSGSAPITWTFPIKTLIEAVAWNDINDKFAGSDEPAFTLAGGVTVQVTGLPGGRTLTCSGADGATILAKILKGRYVPQKGIMDASEVPALVDAYTNYDETKLAAYGEISGSVWTFTFRTLAELTGDQVYGKMPIGSADYNFAFDTGKSVTVDGTAVTAGELKILFAGSGKITSADDLFAARNANEVKRRLYGTRNTSGQWEFPIDVTSAQNSTIELNYKTYSGLFRNEDMCISLIDGTVKITNLPGSRTIENCSADDLTRILLGTYEPEAGEVKEGEMPALIAAYNVYDGSDTSDLEAFGTVNGSSWTFKLTASATLSGEQVYGRMKTGGGKPDYNFVFADGVTVTVDGATVTPAQLKTLFTESGTVASASDLRALLADNPMTRRLYGTWSGSTWTFPISQSIADVEWNMVFEQFEGDSSLVFTIPDDVTVTLINLPDNRPQLDCTGAAGAADLAKILKGEYEFSDESAGGGESGGTEQDGD